MLQHHKPTEQPDYGDLTPPRTLRDHVANALANYFDSLEGQPPVDLYNLVMSEVEPPLLQAAMKQTRNNQSRTAEMLGLNRGTLRKKLKQYDLL
jgi:Fis family transcriptional regulator